jgi:hypothetical protein
MRLGHSAPGARLMRGLTAGVLWDWGGGALEGQSI